MLKVLEVTKEVSDDAMESNKEAQGFLECPPLPSCEDCPARRRVLADGDRGLHTGEVCFWGRVPRFEIPISPRYCICKHHPQYGKPWPPTEDE